MNNIGQNNFGQPDNNDDRVIINANNDIPDFQDCNNNLQLNNQGLITEINNNNGQIITMTTTIIKITIITKIMLVIIICQIIIIMAIIT